MYNIKIIRCALSDSVRDSSPPASTVDQLFFRKGIRVDYLKADVEGAEARLLCGARKTIASCRPRIAITTYHDENNWQEMLGIVKDVCPSYRYKIKGIYHVNKKPVMMHMWV